MWLVGLWGGFNISSRCLGLPKILSGRQGSYLLAQTDKQDSHPRNRSLVRSCWSNKSFQGLWGKSLSKSRQEIKMVQQDCHDVPPRRRRKSKARNDGDKDNHTYLFRVACAMLASTLRIEVLESGLPEFESCCHLLTVWPWVNCLVSLCLRCFICRTRIIHTFLTGLSWVK